MKSVPHGLIGLILAGAVAVCLASQQLYGQGNAGGNDPLARWRATSPGMSTNAALAFYRLQNSRPATGRTTPHPRFQSGSQNAYSSSFYPESSRHTGLPSTGLEAYSPPPTRQAVSKPFADIRPAPTAFERYWPLMLRGEQDPKTGFIYWSLQ